MTFRQFKQIFFLLVLITTPLLANAHNARECAKALSDSPKQNKPAYEKALKHFQKSKSLLYSFNQTDLPDILEFYSSNEADYFKAPLVLEKVDLVIGYGTNSAWDLAIRMGASDLVIGDINWGPLIAQEYILKPLLLVSKNRYEFLSLLSGVAPTARLAANASLDKIFEAVDNSEATIRQTAEFIGKAMVRVEKDPRLGKTYVPLLQAYYVGRLAMHYMMDMNGEEQRVREELKSLSAFPSENSDQATLIYESFWQRYEPSHLIEEGASKIVVNAPEFSFLSTEQNLKKMAQLFDGHVHYIHADYQDIKAYESILKNSEKKSPKVAISTSNIIDVTFSPREAPRAWRDFGQSIAGGLFSRGVKAPIPFFQTRGTQGVHRFESMMLEPAQ